MSCLDGSFPSTNFSFRPLLTVSPPNSCPFLPSFSPVTTLYLTFCLFDSIWQSAFNTTSLLSFLRSFQAHTRLVLSTRVSGQSRRVRRVSSARPLANLGYANVSLFHLFRRGFFARISLDTFDDIFSTYKLLILLPNAQFSILDAYLCPFFRHQRHGYFFPFQPFNSFSRFATYTTSFTSSRRFFSALVLLDPSRFSLTSPHRSLRFRPDRLSWVLSCRNLYEWSHPRLDQLAELSRNHRHDWLKRVIFYFAYVWNTDYRHDILSGWEKTLNHLTNLRGPLMMYFWNLIWILRRSWD